MSKVESSSEVRDEQRVNIPSIEATDEVLNEVKSSEVRDEQPLNI